jgi:hypothetical protein
MLRLIPEVTTAFRPSIKRPESQWNRWFTQVGRAVASDIVLLNYLHGYRLRKSSRSIYSEFIIRFLLCGPGLISVHSITASPAICCAMIIDRDFPEQRTLGQPDARPDPRQQAKQCQLRSSVYD